MARLIVEEYACFDVLLSSQRSRLPNGCNVKQIRDQNNIDCPDQNNAYNQEVIEEFEDEVSIIKKGKT